VPEGGIAAEAGAGGAAGELVVTGGAIVAAAGSVLLVCLTVSAAVDGAATPIDIADEVYGTHFGDVSGWVQGQHPVTKAPRARKGPTPAPLAPPGASPKSERDKDAKKSRGRIYVTYTKFNKITHRYCSGRTSMVVDLTRPLEEQASLAVILRDVNHHIDENDEPNGDAFDFGNVMNSMLGPPLIIARDMMTSRIGGREQQLIDSHGGAWSDTGKPYQTENAVRGVAKDNPWGRRFYDAATDLWGQLYPYTGY
jgi:hypothetical protein